jgi:hypothetical protein
VKTGRDSIPGLRRAVLELLSSNTELPIGAIIERVRKPASTTRRAVEELHALGVLEHARGSSGADVWGVTSWAMERFHARVPVCRLAQMGKWSRGTSSSRFSGHIPGHVLARNALQQTKNPHGAGFQRADDRVRTGDPQLGKLMLYQLSYVRDPLTITD